MALLTNKNKQPDAQEALDSAIAEASKSAVVSQMWSLISIAKSLDTIARKLNK